MATRARRGQALMELAVGLFALALVVSALCGFAIYIVKSLRAQNGLRSGGGTSTKSDEVVVGDFESRYVFGRDVLKIDAKVQLPERGGVR